MVSVWGRRALLALVAAAALLVGAPAGIALAGPSLPAQVAAADPAGDPAADVAPAADQNVADDDEAAPAAGAAPGASAADRAPRSWETHGRPARLIIVRADSVDVVESGQLTRQTPRVPVPATLAELAGAAPAGWVTVDPAAARLSAAVLLAPRVVLNLHGTSPIVQLAGGPTAADAASIYTGSGLLAAHGITVTSVAPASGRPMPAGPGRPFVAVGGGGRLLATDTTFSDLGSPATEPDGRPGVGFAAGSNGSLVRTTLLRNSTGLRLNGSSGVRLESVQVLESAADGLVLRGDRGTRLVDVRAERNGGNGVLVSGPSSDRPITGISTTGNGKFGLAVLGQNGLRIAGVTSRADGTGGLQLSGGADAAVTGLTAVDQPIGVLTHYGAARVGLGGLSVTGSQRGVVVEKTTAGLVLSGSRIEGTGIGVMVGGHGVRLAGVQIEGSSSSALRIERGAGDVTASALTVTGGQDGVIVSAGTSGVVLRELVAEGVADTAVRTASPNAEILGGRIRGGVTGIAADAATIIRGIEISDTEVGLRARSRELVNAEAVRVSAVSSGIAVDDGGRVVLTNSQVQAAEAVQGQVDLVGRNELSLPPLNTLGVIGIPLVLLAILLDQLQRFRARRRRHA